MDVCLPSVVMLTILFNMGIVTINVEQILMKSSHPVDLKHSIQNQILLLSKTHVCGIIIFMYICVYVWSSVTHGITSGAVRASLQVIQLSSAVLSYLPMLTHETKSGLHQILLFVYRAKY